MDASWTDSAPRLSALCSFILLGGGAYAALNVTSADIVNKTINGKDVKPNTLGGKQVNEAGLRLPQLQAGRGDETAVPAEVILRYPKQGLRIETDGDVDTDNSLVIRNTAATGDVNLVFSDSGGSTNVVPGETDTYTAPATRVVDITAARFTASDPTRALHLNCGFPIGDITFCVGIDVRP